MTEGETSPDRLGPGGSQGLGKGAETGQVCGKKEGMPARPVRTVVAQSGTNIRLHTSNLINSLEDEYYAIDRKLQESNTTFGQKVKLMKEQRKISDWLRTVLH